MPPAVTASQLTLGAPPAVAPSEHPMSCWASALSYARLTPPFATETESREKIDTGIATRCPAIALALARTAEAIRAMLGTVRVRPPWSSCRHHDDGRIECTRHDSARSAAASRNSGDRSAWGTKCPANSCTRKQVARGLAASRRAARHYIKGSCFAFLARCFGAIRRVSAWQGGAPVLVCGIGARLAEATESFGTRAWDFYASDAGQSR